MCLTINITPQQESAFAELEQLMEQRSQSALAGVVSDKDIDVVFDEELRSDS